MWHRTYPLCRGIYLHNAVWLRLSHCKICHIAVSGILSWPKPLLAAAISPLLQLCPQTAGTWAMDGCITGQLETVVPKSTKAIAWEPNKVDSHHVLSICYLCDIRLGAIRATALDKAEAAELIKSHSCRETCSVESWTFPAVSAVALAGPFSLSVCT